MFPLGPTLIYKPNQKKIFCDVYKSRTPKKWTIFCGVYKSITPTKRIIFCCVYKARTPTKGIIFCDDYKYIKLTKLTIFCDVYNSISNNPPKMSNLSNFLESKQCIDWNRCNHKNRHPRHDLPQTCGGSKSVCTVWIHPTENFESHPRKFSG